MNPADAATAHLPYTGRGVAWPSGEMVDIDMSSPDAFGAVAYYFDTLCPQDPSPVHGTHPSGAGMAAAHYLLALAKSKGMQVTRGPYLTASPQTEFLPTGWQMVRALVWVEEFDLVVPDEPTAAPCLVTINGDTVVVTPDAAGYLTYADVAQAARFDPDNPPTITFRHADGPPDGILSNGQRVRIRGGETQFDVAVTSGA